MLRCLQDEVSTARVASPLFHSRCSLHSQPPLPSHSQVGRLEQEGIAREAAAEAQGKEAALQLNVATHEVIASDRFRLPQVASDCFRLLYDCS